MTSNACWAEVGGAYLRGFRWPTSILSAAIANTWASPSWSFAHGHVQFARKLLGLGRGVKHVSHQVIVPGRRQLPVNSEPV